MAKRKVIVALEINNHTVFFKRYLVNYLNSIQENNDTYLILFYDNISKVCTKNFEKFIDVNNKLKIQKEYISLDLLFDDIKKINTTGEDIIILMGLSKFKEAEYFYKEGKIKYDWKYEMVSIKAKIVPIHLFGKDTIEYYKKVNFVNGLSYIPLIKWYHLEYILDYFIKNIKDYFLTYNHILNKTVSDIENSTYNLFNALLIKNSFTQQVVFMNDHDRLKYMPGKPVYATAIIRHGMHRHFFAFYDKKYDTLIEDLDSVNDILYRNKCLINYKNFEYIFHRYLFYRKFHKMFSVSNLGGDMFFATFDPIDYSLTKY